MKIDLRPYQVAAFEQARAHIRAGARAVLIVSPTGSGKTVIGSALLERAAAKGRRASFLVDRLSLIDQTSETLDRYGIDHGVIQAQHPRYRPGLPVQICSVQTITRRGWPEGTDVNLFDEAHVLHAAQKALITQRSTVVIGLTATPFTRGLGKYFDAVVNVTTTRELIKDGWLAPYRVFSCAQPDMAGVPVTSMGEWDEKQASSKALEVVGDVVAEYLKHGEGRKFICAGVDTPHVEEIARQFLAAGINVATYTYKDREEDRSDVTKEFRKSSSVIRGLITVTAASRGFDVPDVSCIIMARPLRKSLAEHIQLFGRGLRISPDTGKSDCLILCHSGNMARFWQDTEDFFDNGISQLDDGKPKPKLTPKDRPTPEPIKCPQCSTLHAPRPSCPSCGHEYPRKLTVQHVPGSLKELISGGYHRELARDLWPQICGYVRERRQDDGAEKQALAIYRGMTGSVPQGAWFSSTVPIPPSTEVLNRIRSEQIRFARGRAKGRQQHGAAA